MILGGVPAVYRGERGPLRSRRALGLDVVGDRLRSLAGPMITPTGTSTPKISCSRLAKSKPTTNPHRDQ